MLVEENRKPTILTEEYRHLLQMMIPASNRRGALLSIRDGNPLQAKVLKKIQTLLTRDLNHSITSRGSYAPYWLGGDHLDTQTVDLSFNPLREAKFKFYDETLVEDIKKGDPNVFEFFRLLALCHTVMSEEKPGGILEYQAQSPDEEALTSAARNFGFIFRVWGSNPGLGKVDAAFHPYSGWINEYQACLVTKHWGFASDLTGISARAPPRPRSRDLRWVRPFFLSRSQNRTPASVVIEVMGHREVYDLYCILDFNNVRKRMSVILRKDGVLKLYCKGADSVIFERLDDSCAELKFKTLEHLNVS
ncbi:phospholipid-transporting ATPase ID [Trichonephila clavipes]|nr:phospholipid-transporting ATPase ID [Trichonephila clavipes]